MDFLLNLFYNPSFCQSVSDKQNILIFGAIGVVAICYISCLTSDIYKIHHNEIVFKTRFKTIENFYKDIIYKRNLKINELESQLKQAQDKYSNLTDINIIDRNDSSFLEREELKNFQLNLIKEIQITKNSINDLTNSVKNFFEQKTVLKMCSNEEFEYFKKHYKLLLNTYKSLIDTNTIFIAESIKTKNLLDCQIYKGQNNLSVLNNNLMLDKLEVQLYLVGQTLKLNSLIFERDKILIIIEAKQKELEFFKINLLQIYQMTESVLAKNLGNIEDNFNFETGIF